MEGERPARESTNERLGANVRSLREHKDMSQAELARLMAERGWPWHQSTVYRVESGKQKVGFDEAVDLAAILQTSTDRFTWSSPEASATEFVYSAGARLRQQYDIVAEAVCRLIADSAAAGRVVEAHKDSKWERVHEARNDVAARIEEYNLDAAIEAGIWQYQQRFEHQEGDDDDDGPDEEGQPGVMDQQ